MLQVMAQHNPKIQESITELGLSDVSQLSNLNGMNGYEAFKLAAKKKGLTDDQINAKLVELQQFFMN